MKTNIVLIGFMGVGKGTVARALAMESGKFTLDCDDMIQSFANKKIKDIFSQDGEECFRDIEKRVANFLHRCVKGAIISTGGGFYKVKGLEKIGTIVYLYSDFDEIIKRMSNSPNSAKKFAKRPLLADLEHAKEIFAQREEQYRKKADFIIDVTNKTPQTIAKEIKKLLKIKKQPI